MLSRAQSKYIRSLSQQKFREEHGLFVAEGDKLATEWLNSAAKLQQVVATKRWADANSKLLTRHKEAEILLTEEADLDGVSGLPSPPEVLIVAPIVDPQPLPETDQWFLMLDHIQDPGNMGTIMRIADWFGIGHIICSPGCADIYNPKVVQSAMGAHLRVNVVEWELAEACKKISFPKYAAVLGGENAYTVAKGGAGVLMIGNESKGLAKELVELADKHVSIPGKGGAESLNAGVATGILCALLLPR